MGTSTVSGPFRSENGFQELVNGQWVPVAGGGGGGFVPVLLTNEYASSFGLLDNRYSNDSTQAPPTGPSAGTIIQLPPIQVGGTYYICQPAGASSSSVWALKLPTLPGVDISAFGVNMFAVNYGTITTGSYPVYNIGTQSYGFSPLAGPTDTFYFYGGLNAASWFGITLAAIVTVPVFGTVALFTQSNIPIMSNYTPFPDPYVYPYTQLIGS